MENLQPDYVTVWDNQEIDKILKDIKQKIVVCGYSHVSRVVETDNTIMINPGNVGLPAYDDDLPIPHKMAEKNKRNDWAING